MSCLQLQPFERRHLPLAEPWFLDRDAQRWLGRPAWPQQMLDLAEWPLGEFRGAAESGRYRWLAWEHGSTVGDMGGRDVIDTIPVLAASISYVLNPALRRRGNCGAMVIAVMARPELSDIELFAAGVAPANAGPVGCLRKVGFQQVNAEPGLMRRFAGSVTGETSAADRSLNEGRRQAPHQAQDFDESHRYRVWA